MLLGKSAHSVTFPPWGERMRTVALSPFFIRPTRRGGPQRSKVCRERLQPVATAKWNMPDEQDKSYHNRLYPEDQARVDGFIKRGVNSVERKPFRPLRLVLILIVIVMSLSIFSQYLAHWAGVY